MIYAKYREFYLSILLVIVSCSPNPLRQATQDSRTVSSDKLIDEQVESLLRQMTLQ